jgi:hypothetical protein
LDLRWRKWWKAGLDYIMRSFVAFNTVRTIKSREMRWARHVACMVR